MSGAVRALPHRDMQYVHPWTYVPTRSLDLKIQKQQKQLRRRKSRTERTACLVAELHEDVYTSSCGSPMGGVWGFSGCGGTRGVTQKARFYCKS